MSPLLSDSLTILFALFAKPDVMLKRDSVTRMLGCEHQCAADSAAPLIERGWIHRHLQGNRQITMGYSITDAGITAVTNVTKTISSTY